MSHRRARRNPPDVRMTVTHLDDLVQDAVEASPSGRAEFSREEIEAFVDYVVRGLATLPEGLFDSVESFEADWVREKTLLTLSTYDYGELLVRCERRRARDGLSSLSLRMQVADDLSDEHHDALVEARWERQSQAPRVWVFEGLTPPWETRSNPSSVVRTKRDEQLWAKAKARAADAGHAGDWAYVMGVFKKSRGAAQRGAAQRGRARKNPEWSPRHLAARSAAEAEAEAWQVKFGGRFSSGPSAARRQAQGRAALAGYAGMQPITAIWSFMSRNGFAPTEVDALLAELGRLPDGTLPEPVEKGRGCRARKNPAPAPGAREPTMPEVAHVADELGVPKNLKGSFVRGFFVEWREHGGGLDHLAIGQLVLDHLLESKNYYRGTR